MPHLAKMLLLASVPGVLLLVLGSLPFVRTRTPKALSATAVATGLALLSLQLVVAATLTLDAFSDAADAVLVLIGFPLGVYVSVLGVFFHRRRPTRASILAFGFVGLVALWYLGGAVLVLTACSIAPSGGC